MRDCSAISIAKKKDTVSQEYRAAQVGIIYGVSGWQDEITKNRFLRISGPLVQQDRIEAGNISTTLALMDDILLLQGDTAPSEHCGSP